jgi:hypothetical protein
MEKIRIATGPKFQRLYEGMPVTADDIDRIQGDLPRSEWRLKGERD